MKLKKYGREFVAKNFELTKDYFFIEEKSKLKYFTFGKFQNSGNQVAYYNKVFKKKSWIHKRG